MFGFSRKNSRSESLDAADEIAAGPLSGKPELSKKSRKPPPATVKLDKSSTTNGSGGPPPMPSRDVVLYDCLTGNVHRLGTQPMTFGAEISCDVQLGLFGFKEGKLVLQRSGKRLQLSVEGGNHEIEINGAIFQGGLLREDEEFSLVIDKVVFFLVCVGEGAASWVENVRSSTAKSWYLQIIEGGMDRFHQWKNLDEQRRNQPFPGLHVIRDRTVLEVIDEVAKRSWDQQVGIVYHNSASAGFFASQFKQLSQPEQLSDAGKHRCPRCWMRFDPTQILAIHPSERGDGAEGLGESELKRFIPRRFGVDGTPLTNEGLTCTRLACPHCRGELPPHLLEKAPHMISIVGDSMSGKSYFLSVAVRQLARIFPAKMGISFTDADPAGNAALAKMIARLFNPSRKPEDTFIVKTEFAGETYHEYQRHGNKVKLPRPFTYNLVSRERGSSSIVLYDNAGEHFRPGYLDNEKSNATEHLAWASGILFLFDPLQHRDLLIALNETVDPQIGRMMNAGSGLKFDQHVILAEISERLRAWRQLSIGQAHDVPLALVVGKHDLLEDLLPVETLSLEVCADGKLSKFAIDSNSDVTRAFLLEHCPDIVGAAENISQRVKYFPVSAFGSPAIELKGVKTSDGGIQIGPDSKNLKPYLVEAPFLWVLSEAESSLVGSA